MQVEVKISGMTFQTGQKNLSLELPEESTITDVLVALSPLLPSGIVEGSAIAPIIMLNGRQARQSDEVADGDLIRLLYILKGG